MRYSLAFLSFFHVRVSFLSLVSNCFVPLIIFGFKYQPEFFSGAVYRGVKSMVNGERHWAIVLEQKRGKREGGRENRGGRLHLTGNSKIVSRRKRRLFGSIGSNASPKVMFAALHEIYIFDYADAE